jgi:hypothetical protein
MTSLPSQRSFAALRGFARPKPVIERCDLCGVDLPPHHGHLLELPGRRLLCACDACALLFVGQAGPRYRPIPRVAELLADFRMSDAQWESLHIPINLAFFTQSSETGRVMALYPSPAGAMESLLPLETWLDLARDNPVLQEFETDVEALLVYRVGGVREHYRAGIDRCFQLVGLIRARWRGLGGGDEAWQAITRFFAQLKGQTHA